MVIRHVEFAIEGDFTTATTGYKEELEMDTEDEIKKDILDYINDEPTEFPIKIKKIWYEEEPEEKEDEEGILDKFDTELILQTAICRISEFSHKDKKTGKVVPTYEKLIEDIQEMMCEVGIPT